MFWDQFYNIVYESNDTKMNSISKDYDDQSRKKKRRPISWGRNESGTTQHVYVCVEPARRREKRAIRSGDKSQKPCQHATADLEATPIRKNKRNCYTPSSIKQTLSFSSLGVYDDNQIFDEFSQPSCTPLHATFAKATSNFENELTSIHVSGTSRTPSALRKKQWGKEKDLAANDLIAREIHFESFEKNANRTRPCMNGVEPSKKLDSGDGNSDIDYESHACKNEIGEDDSVVSTYSLNEQYSSTIIRIPKDNSGEIVFEYPNTKSKKNYKHKIHDLETTRPTKDVNGGVEIEYHDSFLDDISWASSLSKNEITQNDSTSNFKSSATDGKTSSNGFRRTRKRSRVDLSNDESLPTPSFELTTTNYKTKEDEIEKELIACFKANNENFTNLSYPVSDLVLAKFIEEKNPGNINGDHKNDNKKLAKGTLDNFTNFINMFKGSMNVTAEEISPRNDTSTEPPIPEPQKAIEPTPKKNIVRLKLSKYDEIHVSPCQCALSLVGLRGVTPLDTKVISANDGESMFNFFNILNSPPESASNASEGFLKFPFFGDGNIGTDKDVSAKKINNEDIKNVASRTSTTPLLSSDTDEKVTSGQQSQQAPVENRNVKRGKLVRTNSAQVADDQDENIASQKKQRKRKNSTVNWSLAHTESGYDSEALVLSDQVQQKPSDHLVVRRDNRWDYESVGYHEITLIRNKAGDDINNEDSTNVNDEFIDWRAVTIRCRDHDELDTLVKALKESSSAKIVPFSSNPKKKLRKPKPKNERKCLKIPTTPKVSIVSDDISTELRDGRERRRSLSTIHDPQSNCISTSCSSEDELKTPDILPTNKDSKENKQRNILSSGSQLIKKIPWDFNFNKKAYCELCDFRFTLLTRRHHCRKCERSCCGHCSFMLLVEGGGEKRYCNICSAHILKTQSEALHKRLRKRISETVLPGKVHPSCHRLGVGVIGKLPHWKNYVGVSAEQRPAVGRLTVEIIEALALPSVKQGHGMVDPYVRATITGYDRDFFWFLREWLPRKRFSLCSGYCSSTVSPVWRGCGGCGGERLTLPVISTAGAVLRLEVLHYNVMTNARGKDCVLGIVEIPLSDLPNSNMRQLEGLGTDRYFDGYCDRWYRLLPVDHAKSNVVRLSKPIPSPHTKKSSNNDKEVPGSTVVKSLEEIGKHVQELFIAPVEWFASAIKLDLPARRPEVICKEHRARSTIHVRIKLNASHVGDLLSHAWFPPVKPHPSYSFDPQLMLNRIQQIIKLIAPYHAIIQFIEDVIKWKHDTKTCLKAYCVFAFHLAFIPQFVYLLHVYLVFFLGMRLRLMNVDASDAHKDEDSPSDSEEDSLSDTSIHQFDSVESDESAQLIASTKTESYNHYIRNSPSLGRELYLRENELPHLKQKECRNIRLKPRKSSSNKKEEEEEEETAKLNKAVTWLAKRLGHGKGLDILQFKLTMTERHIRDFNSVWDGSNRLLTKVAILCIILSFMLHFLVSRRILWLVGTSTWYFAQAPRCKLYARAFLGFWRGVAKTTRRQHLLDAEILELTNMKNVRPE